MINFCWPIIRRHHKRRFHVVFTVRNVSVILTEKERTHMATSMTVGQTLPLSIAELDQNGHPMTTFVTPDSPPTWTQSDTSNTLTVSADGLTATLTGVTVGTDTLSLTVAAGGKTFSATLDVVIAAAVQVLTSVEIVAGTPA